MIFKSIYFNLNRENYSNEYGYSLLLKSRFFCNYIEREVLKPLRINTSEFNRLSIEFKDNPNSKIWINSSNVMILNFEFNKTEYEKAFNNNVATFFIKYLQLAIERIEDSDFDIPTLNIDSGIKSFVDDGYQNKWLYKKKKNRELGIESFLNCTLTEESFKLTLSILKNKITIFSKVILKTDPDPVAYDYRFKDIIFKNNLLIISSKTYEDLFELNLDELE